MSDPTHAFIYRAQCGCVRGRVTDRSEEAPRWTREDRDRYLARGYVEYRMPIVEAPPVEPCRHKEPGQPAVGQQGLFEGGAS